MSMLEENAYIKSKAVTIELFENDHLYIFKKLVSGFKRTISWSLGERMVTG
jgi:hypothetical protein